MKKLALLFFVLASIPIWASNLEVSTPILYQESGQAYAVFNISWQNAWNNNANNDAIWLFLKAIPQGGVYQHIKVMNKGHKVVEVFSKGEPALAFHTPDDGIGVFLYPSRNYRGDIHAILSIAIDPGSFEGINTRRASLSAYGIEMVRIPEGGFLLGGIHENAINHGAIYRPDKNGEPGGLVKVNTENQEFEVSASGDLYYKAPEGYEGDQQGTIPSTYPKGVNPFFMMKYETSEGQYVKFLNSLNTNQLTNRRIFEAEKYYELWGSIVEEEGVFKSKFPDKPCNFMSWDDAMAYADWAGLRPMSEFEFTKAARGTGAARALNFPWGTDTKDQVQRLPNQNGELTMLNEWNEGQLSEINKTHFGASYYWVLDLAGSMWERVVTIGHEQGRRFKGSHGDGKLSSQGNATNDDWPVETKDSGGIGFRGGGFYGYDRSYHEYNPFSPVAYRPYGGWHGGMRSEAYGTRFVRTMK